MSLFKKKPKQKTPVITKPKPLSKKQKKEISSIIIKSVERLNRSLSLEYKVRIKCEIGIDIAQVEI